MALKLPSLRATTLVILFCTGLHTEANNLDEKTKASLKSRADAALARHLGRREIVTKLENIESVEWPDTSLGCPQPGMMYPQMIVPGYKVEIKIGSETFTAHMDEKRAVICDSTRLFPNAISNNKSSE